ncbi:hypothetical protein [Sulfurimonas sp.]|jgi:hypothetical protein|uniref:hypothetical protein n=1 Tax=Sulfurimonas sp. TaxID=2022749 RepID=UPI0025E2DE47|nr:hypothetical protein [Sulfurimonas sp.]MCK9474034.1 hypothetical protein [Sulfurimonas sp.]MDD3505591.1 hypothetical protein [Sulfurimonas sp.]
MKIIVLVLTILSFLYSEKIDLKIENKRLIEKIDKLENIVKKQEKLLKTKESKEKNHIFYAQECEEKSIFPKLIMKDEYQKKSFDKDEIITFQASAFRLKTDSIIYDGINGNAIDKWERGTSFTSNTMSEGWVKISGYFVNRKWKKAQKELWVRSAQTIKREQ